MSYVVFDIRIVSWVISISGGFKGCRRLSVIYRLLLI